MFDLRIERGIERLSPGYGLWWISAGMRRSRADDAGESGCEQHANALRPLRVARADNRGDADQFDIRSRAPGS